jgi:hypothetical protein
VRRCLISDSALKVVFLTTLYVDVKEPAVQRILATKKLNLVPTKITVPAVTRGFRFRCRDKIEPNLQSQMYVERTPTWWSPASSGIDSLLEIGAASMPSHRFPEIFCECAIHLAPIIYLFSQPQTSDLRCAECKIR